MAGAAFDCRGLRICRWSLRSWLVRHTLDWWSEALASDRTKLSARPHKAGRFEFLEPEFFIAVLAYLLRVFYYWSVRSDPVDEQVDAGKED